MAQLTISGVKITGMAAAVPPTIVRNEDYDWIPEKDRAALIATTGIKERRFADSDVCTSDLGVFAANKLLEELAWDRKEIELLVFVSQNRDYILPNTACLIQDRLQLPKTCMAFDVPLGCSGYVYGLSIVASLLSKGSIKKAVLITGDVSTFALSYKDKSSYPIFGDAAAATAIEYTGNNDDVMYFENGTDGSGYQSIVVPAGGNRNPFTPETLIDIEYEPGIIRNQTKLALDGIKIFEFTIREVAKNIKSLIKYAGKTPEEFDYYILHQANMLMNETVRKQLKLAAEAVPYTLPKYGNTSSASIPLTIISELNKEASTQTHNYILSGFGVGLSWATAAIKLSNIVCPPVYDYQA